MHTEEGRALCLEGLQAQGLVSLGNPRPFSGHSGNTSSKDSASCPVEPLSKFLLWKDLGPTQVFPVT